MRNNRLRLFEHVIKKDDSETVRIYMEINVESRGNEDQAKGVLWNSE